QRIRTGDGQVVVADAGGLYRGGFIEIRRLVVLGQVDDVVDSGGFEPGDVVLRDAPRGVDAVRRICGIRQVEPGRIARLDSESEEAGGDSANGPAHDCCVHSSLLVTHLD